MLHLEMSNLGAASGVLIGLNTKQPNLDSGYGIKPQNFRVHLYSSQTEGGTTREEITERLTD